MGSVSPLGVRERWRCPNCPRWVLRPRRQIGCLRISVKYRVAQGQAV